MLGEESEAKGLTLSDILLKEFGQCGCYNVQIDEIISRYMGSDNDGYKFANEMDQVKFCRFVKEVLSHDFSDKLTYHGNGRWDVLGRYWYFSKSSKWQGKGRAKVYNSKSFTDFLNRFVLDAS